MRFSTLVLGGMVPVVCPIPTVSMVTTQKDMESCGTHGKDLTPSNIFSSKYVNLENTSTYDN